MKFKELTEDDKNYAYKIYIDKSLSWDERMGILVKFFGKSERTVRKWCSEKLGFKEKEELECEQLEEAKNKVFDKTKKRFLITWAQNNTPVHLELLKNMEAYAKFLDADIHIIAGRYKNPTSVFTDRDYEYWEDEVSPYLDANRHNIHKYISIMADIKIQPTAVNPMSGLEGVSGINSCIFGSPKVQLQTIPVLHPNQPKMMLTTGSVTKPNFTDSKSGKKGEFHHTYGFVIVEIKDDEVFYVRQVTADDVTGNFSDLYYRVENENIKRIDAVEAIILGDLHVGDHDPILMESTYKLLNEINPKNVILHDVFNGASINHHEADDPFKQYQKEISGTNSLKNEIELMLCELEKFNKYNVVVVRSNHDDFIDRWLVKTDWRKTVTPKNSLEYMKFSTAILSGQAPNGIIPWIIKEKYPKFVTLGRGDSFRIKKWELGQHGDIGSNGSRGSLNQYRRLNTKMVVGHSHSPGRKDGILQVGTSTNLRLNYNLGPSSWLQSHVIIHEDGRAQHINFIKHGFTTLEG